MVTCLFPTIAYASDAVYSLKPDSITATIGTVVDLDIVLDTNGARTGAADVAVSYPRKKLELVEIIDGPLFGQYVGKVVDNRRGIGMVSGLASLSDSVDYFSGTGTFATLRFRALSPGVAPITFTFKPGSANDRNNVSDADIIVDVEDPVGTDILAETHDAEISIPDDGSPTIPAEGSTWTDVTTCDACVQPSPVPLASVIAGVASYGVMLYGGYLAYTTRHLRHTKKRKLGKRLIAGGGIALFLIVITVMVRLL